MVRALTKIATDCPRRQSVLKNECRETLGERGLDSSFFCRKKWVLFFPQRGVCAACSGLMFLSSSAGTLCAERPS